MSFSDTQIAALRRKLDERHVHSREIQGRELSYIEGWHAIAEANRIFGFGSWDRETTETKCLLAREETRGTFHAIYSAKVRITVRAEADVVTREAFGTGEGLGNGLGQAHEKALKTAETDATKRALATFGSPFGLALYRSHRNNRRQVNETPLVPIPDESRRRTHQKIGPDGRFFVPRRIQPPIDPELAHSEMSRLSELTQSLASAPSGSTPQTAETSAPSPPEPIIQHATQSEAVSKSGQAESALPVAPGLQTVSQEPASLMIEWPKRRRDPAHLRYVRTQPCLICGRTPSDAHHVRFAQVRALGRKVSDEFTVPLCRVHHRKLHDSGKETDWWQAIDQDIDPLQIAKDLWQESRRLIARASENPAENNK